MGFLRRLFGGQQRPYVDTDGIYFYVKCDRCGTIVRVRADKRHDLNQTDTGHEWHKTIVDNRCFQPIQALVRFDGRHVITHQEIDKGVFVTEAEYELSLAPPPADDEAPPPADDEAPPDQSQA